MRFCVGDTCDDFFGPNITWIGLLNLDLDGVVAHESEFLSPDVHRIDDSQPQNFPVKSNG